MSVYILVVDDEPDVEALFRQQFRRDLRSGRFTMEFAPSAPAALARAADIADPLLILILSDINMPGMSGLEMLPKVRAERPDVPVIMITAYGDAETRRKAIERGAVGLLTKSIDYHPDVDMVVSDINMPRMDGLSLLQKLQDAEDKKSTIIVSAYGDMSNIRTAMNRGAFDFLTKPIDFGDLEATIDKTIRHVEVTRDARRRPAEAERAHASLLRYFSPQIATTLASRGASNGMEVHRREVATIFTDITRFTTLV